MTPRAPRDGALEERAARLGADLVLEGGGVRGIGLVGAVTALADAGVVFPRIGGTSAGAVVGALTAAYQRAGEPLDRLRQDLDGLDLPTLLPRGPLQRATGLVGDALAVAIRSGVAGTEALGEWLGERLAAVGVRTFGDLRIEDDPGTSLLPEQRYRLVVHASDLTRRVLVRIPWDLPQYLLPEGRSSSEAQRLAAIDAYPVVDAVRASASLPYVYRPFQQPTPQGTCTWADGGLLQYFPITVFDRTDGMPARWPTWGVRLSARHSPVMSDRPRRTVVGESVALLRTAIAQWDRYALTEEGVDERTAWVDTAGIASTDFDLDASTRARLYANGRTAAEAFLAHRPQAFPSDG